MNKHQHINLSFLESFTKSDPQKMVKYIQMFLQSAPAAIKTMEENLQEQNWESLKTTAHSLKPQLGYMGIDALKETLVRIEEYAGEQKNPGALTELLRTVNDICREAFIELEETIKNIS